VWLSGLRLVWCLWILWCNILLMIEIGRVLIVYICCGILYVVMCVWYCVWIVFGLRMVFVVV